MARKPPTVGHLFRLLTQGNRWKITAGLIPRQRRRARKAFAVRWWKDLTADANKVWPPGL